MDDLQRAMAATAILKFSENRFRNFVQNLEYMQRSAPADLLGGAFRGHPALVVASGPSFERAAPFIGALRDKALIVAVDSMFAPLARRCKTIPHLTVALDPQPLATLKFPWLDPTPSLWNRSALVYAPGYTPPMPARFAHTFVWNDDTDVYGRTLNTWTRREPGANVLRGHIANAGHLAYYTALLCGCNPIYLIGVDFSTQEGAHAKGVALTAEPTAQTFSIPTVGRGMVESSLVHINAMRAMSGAARIAREKLGICTVNLSHGARIEGVDAEDAPEGALPGLRQRKPVDYGAAIRGAAAYPLLEDRSLFDTIALLVGAHDPRGLMAPICAETFFGAHALQENPHYMPAALRADLIQSHWRFLERIIAARVKTGDAALVEQDRYMEIYWAMQGRDAEMAARWAKRFHKRAGALYRPVQKVLNRPAVSQPLNAHALRAMGLLKGQQETR